MKIKEKVYEILKNLSCMETVQDSDRLQDDLILDSLAMVTLLLEIEDVFNIELNESDMNPFDLITVEDVIHLAEKYGEEINEKKC